MTGNLYTDLVCNTTSKFCTRKHVACNRATKNHIHIDFDTASLDAASVFSLSVASNMTTMLWDRY